MTRVLGDAAGFAEGSFAFPLRLRLPNKQSPSGCENSRHKDRFDRAHTFRCTAMQRSDLHLRRDCS
ncbi:hypothetical protein Pla52o_03620 [Novipirellula galeiformis]|uniref:Uncharacterized protein n=1 Tax=Novipirellula galeiformis TaxID=2528004 RepID=A0A5C6CUU1_9BACT|nr:hypothetical protein Pla52o_03620 [Novipirellula galeiformis]